MVNRIFSHRSRPASRPVADIAAFRVDANEPRRRTRDGLSMISIIRGTRRNRTSGRAETPSSGRAFHAGRCATKVVREMSVDIKILIP